MIQQSYFNLRKRGPGWQKGFLKIIGIVLQLISETSLDALPPCFRFLVLSLSLCFVFKKDVLIYLEDLQKERDEETEILHLLFYSPYDCNSQGSAQWNQRARSIILVSHMGRGGPSSWNIFCCFTQAH